MNETVTISSLRLYADDTIQYKADKSPVALQYTLNQDVFLALLQLSPGQREQDASNDPWEINLPL